MFAAIITLTIFSFDMIIKLVLHQLQQLPLDFLMLFQRSILVSHLFLSVLLAQQVLLTHLLELLLFLLVLLQLLPLLKLTLLLVSLHAPPVMARLVFHFEVMSTILFAQYLLKPALQQASLVLTVEFKHYQAHLAAYFTA